MRRFRKSFAVVLTVILAMTLAAPTALAAKPHSHHRMGALAYSYVEALTRVVNPDGTETLIKRVAGTPAELAAANQIKCWFAQSGLKTQFQPFTYVRQEVTYNSQNVVGLLQPPRGTGRDPRRS